MTPQEIARAAAEAIASDVFNYDTELPQVKRDEIPAIAALILTAAAKMVRQSGAVEALEASKDMLVELHHDHADNWPEHQLQKLYDTGEQIRRAIANIPKD